MGQDHARGSSEPPVDDAALAELLEGLTQRVEVPLDPEDLSRAVRSAGGERASWSSMLEAGAAGVGLRVRWLVAPLADAVALARPDLPVVARGDAGGWWVLDGRVPGLVHAVPVADPRGGRWLTAAGLAERIGGDGTRRWALIEPELPAAPLASGSGERTPARRLRALLWAERRDVSAVVVYGIAAGLLSLATPLAIQVLINWLAFGALLQPVVLLGVGLLVCLSLAAAFQVLQRVTIEALERRVFVRTVADLSVRLSRARPEGLLGGAGPELANRFFEVLTLQKAAGTLLLEGVTAVLQVGVAVTLLALYHPWLLLFDIVLLAGMAVSLVPLGRGAQRTAIGESKMKYAVAAWIEEVARHPAVLRQDGSRLAEDRADELARRWLGTRQAHFTVFLRQFAGAQALQVLMSAVLLVTCGALVLRGQLTIGQFVAAEFIVTAALLGFTKFADKLDTVYDLLAGVDKLGALLDLPLEAPHGRGLRRSAAAEVVLEGVSVGPGGTAPAVDLRLAPRSRTVVLAPPGSGKTALGLVVSGLLDAPTGAARRDGADQRHLRPEARHAGVVRVAPGDLLIGSVRDNVALGRDAATDAAVWEALEAVGLARRVESLPRGLDAVLPSTAAPLSDTERRALLVARAIVASPALVVVDGVLDGLPPLDAARLGEALDRVPGTLLVLTADPAAAHRTRGRLLTLGSGGLDDRSPLARC